MSSITNRFIILINYLVKFQLHIILQVLKWKHLLIYIYLNNGELMFCNKSDKCFSISINVVLKLSVHYSMDVLWNTSYVYIKSQITFSFLIFNRSKHEFRSKL